MAHDPRSAYPRQGMYIPPGAGGPIPRAINEPDWAGGRTAHAAHMQSLASAYAVQARAAFAEQFGSGIGNEVVGLSHRASTTRLVQQNVPRGAVYTRYRRGQVAQRDNTVAQVEEAADDVLTGKAPGDTGPVDVKTSGFWEDWDRMRAEKAARDKSVVTARSAGDRF